MPRLDARVKTKLPATLLNHNDGSNYEKDTVISELSLSGALIDTPCHGLKDIVTIKPELAEFNETGLKSEVTRKYDGKVAVIFHYSHNHTKATLWNYIKEHLTNTNVCPYCNCVNNIGVLYCSKCKWLLNFNDMNYLDKHTKETFVAKIQNLSDRLTAGQMQRIMNFMDNGMIEKNEGPLKKESIDNSKDMQEMLLPVEGVVETKLKYLPVLKKKPSCKICFESIVSQHPNMVQILKLIAQIADTDANILIQGESGTGKELIARALHCNSSRNDKPFVPVNCGAVHENLLESELFGHARGSFTGAVKDKVGLFESADGGTIFLDEVSEMAPSMQVKLLRILQSGEYNRVGSAEICHSNARILTATNRDLLENIGEGRFREDLYYRLNVLDIVLPPLRERKCDIPILSQHFLDIYGLKYGKEDLRLSQNAEALLSTYGFPGNVRELENIIQRAVVLANGKYLEAHHLPKALYKGKTSFKNKEKISTFRVSKQKVIEQFERRYIMHSTRHSRREHALSVQPPRHLQEHRSWQILRMCLQVCP